MTISTTARSTLAFGCCCLALLGCGTPKPTGNTTHGSGSVAGASPTPSGRGGRASNVTVGRTFWFQRFKVTVTAAAVGYLPDQPAYDTNQRLTISMTMENIGQDTHQFQPEMAVTEADQNYTSPNYNLPAVPGGEKQDGTVVFVIKPGFKLGDAVLIVGSARMEQAKVPLGKNGDYVSLEPQSFAVSGNIAVGGMTLTLTGGVFAADRDYYNDADPGHLILTLNYSATKTSDGGRGSVSSDVFFLKLPDGTAVPALDGSDSPNLPTGTTKQDLWVRFDVKKPVDGAYDLVAKGNFTKDYTNAQGDLQFNVSLGSPGGAQATPSIPGSNAFSPEPQATPSGH